MPNPTRDEIKQAAELVISMAVQYRELFDPDHTHPHEIVARALLSAYEREEKMLAVMQEAIDGRPPREWVQRMADLYVEAKLSAIKAAEEGR